MNNELALRARQNRLDAPHGQIMKKPASRIAIVAVVLAALGCGLYLFVHRTDVSTDDAAIDGATVTISPKVAGYVKTLAITDNQLVKAGDVLLVLDEADYLTRRDRAKAVLEGAGAAAEAARRNAETATVTAPSTLAAAEAHLAAATANWDKAARDLKRMQRLSNDARSKEQLDQAVSVEKGMRAALEAAQAQLRAAETAPHVVAEAQSNRDRLAAQVREAEAALQQAELDLANTKITAPIDGRIAKRGVERGNYVQPGQALTTLVGNDLWVVANFKETQLRNVRVGQPVRIAIDAYPDKILTGKIDSIQAGTGAFFSAFPPENATGNFVKVVQRVPVKIVFDQAPDPALALGPGMSVVPTVDTSGHD